MAEYNNNMTGIISQNKKRDKDTSPHYLGSCEINNEKYWIAGWRKERKDGSGQFLSLSFKPVDETAQAEAVHAEEKVLTEDCPF